MIARSAWVPTMMLAIVLGALGLRIASAIHESMILQTLLHTAGHVLG